MGADAQADNGRERRIDAEGLDGLPPPPERPDPRDCCGGGCTPCILDAYEEALERWKREVARLRSQRRES